MRAFGLGIALSAVVLLSTTVWFSPVLADETMELKTGEQDNAEMAAPNTLNRKVVYLFNQDYPPQTLVGYPTPPMSTAHFWKMLDKEMRQTQTLGLTENLEEADYNVEVKCSGIMGCSKLRVYIKSPKRDVLTAYTLRGIKQNPIAHRPVDQVAKRLAQSLEERISKLEQGDFGYGNY